MSRTQSFEWLKHFKGARMLVGEEPRPGRTSTSTNDDHVKTVHAVIGGNRRLTVRKVADKVGISTGSCHQIFTEKLQMRRISAKFVPCARSHVAPHLQLFGKTSDFRCAPSTLLSGLSPNRLFPVSQT
jgi:hypothetical protein